jgi:hypothetical protein
MMHGRVPVVTNGQIMEGDTHAKAQKTSANKQATAPAATDSRKVTPVIKKLCLIPNTLALLWPYRYKQASFCRKNLCNQKTR